MDIFLFLGIVISEFVNKRKKEKNQKSLSFCYCIGYNGKRKAKKRILKGEMTMLNFMGVW